MNIFNLKICTNFCISKKFVKNLILNNTKLFHETKIKLSPNEHIKNHKHINQKDLKSTLYYVTAAGILAAGLSYAAVPLYRMFCQVNITIFSLP